MGVSRRPFPGVLWGPSLGLRPCPLICGISPHVQEAGAAEISCLARGAAVRWLLCPRAGPWAALLQGSQALVQVQVPFLQGLRCLVYRGPVDGLGMDRRRAQGLS